MSIRAGATGFAVGIALWPPFLQLTPDHRRPCWLAFFLMFPVRAGQATRLDIKELLCDQIRSSEMRRERRAGGS